MKPFAENIDRLPDFHLFRWWPFGDFLYKSSIFSTSSAGTQRYFRRTDVNQENFTSQQSHLSIPHLLPLPFNNLSSSSIMASSKKRKSAIEGETAQEPVKKPKPAVAKSE